MVHVPGSSADSGIHRESQEDVQVKIEQGIEMSSDPGSTTTSLNARSADQQSARRNSVDGNEDDLDPDPDLEEKPHPPQVSGKETPADPDSRQDPLTKQAKMKGEPYSFIDPDKPTLYMPKDPQVLRPEVGKPNTKTLRTKMKAPEYEEDGDQDGSGWSVEDLKYSYHWKELRDFVCQDPVMKTLKLKRIAEPKDPVTSPAVVTNKLDAVTVLIKLLKEAGMIPGSFDPDDLFDLDLTVIQTTSRDLFQKLKNLVGEAPQIGDPVSSPQIDVVDNLTSSHYTTAAEDGSDTSSEPQRMSLGPSGAAMLEARSKIRHPNPIRSSSQPKGSTPTDQATITSSSDRSAGTLQTVFNAAMDRFLAEQQAAGADPIVTEPQNAGSRDVDMESIRSSDRGSNWEYDPDDIDFPAPAQAAAATAASGSTGPTMIQQVRISAISDLKEYSGKDPDEDRARAWISKVKSAFMRDQASDEDKCLTFADLLAGSAKNWYRQLNRSMRNKSDESPLDYLYRLNVAGLRARLKIKDGSAKDQREHVDHFIETLEDPDLADRLTLIRLSDADDLEEVLRARDRAKSRQKKAAFGSGKFRQKASNAAPSAPAKQVRAIQIQAADSGSDSSDGSDGSDSEMDSHRRIYLAAKRNDHAGSGTSGPGAANEVIRRIIAFLCGKLHDMGECPMEEFYNQIRQWFNPTKHMGMLPEAAEKMLN
ncbi:hypothetical protein PHMEG_00032326 [Phytophthora megakarya]|uniref:Eukaryotic/viral aspartic protease n=1 Tax=Phytophthora megakarya TaxID=4795 RepID=A0A225UVY4_9STRA|nr:hypothetical protein PHMEG_00032326 [Phytophthora megakarya]